MVDEKSLNSQPAIINSFSGKYFFLSNFYLADVSFEGALYPSVEHAYQAAKSEIGHERSLFNACITAGQAKRLGRKISLREDWELIKFEVMRLLVQRKFVIWPELREKLLLTGDAHLEEGNTWGDRVWGTVDGVGQNMLGKILMETRDKIKMENFLV